MLKNKILLLVIAFFVTINLYAAEKNFVDNVEDLACLVRVDLEKHPWFKYLIQKVKQDFGIEEHVAIWWLVGREDFAARYHFNHNFITVSDLYVHGLSTPAFKRFALAHEFEHHRQFKRYLGSYKNFEIDRDKKAFWLALEQGADAAAAGYIECEICLKNITNMNKEKQHIVQTDCGVFTSEKGYFTQQDFEPYIQRAQNEKSICLACWKQVNCRNAYIISYEDYFELIKSDATLQEHFELCNN